MTVRWLLGPRVAAISPMLAAGLPQDDVRGRLELEVVCEVLLDALGH
jgi:hypothetical protein